MRLSSSAYRGRNVCKRRWRSLYRCAVVVQCSPIGRTSGRPGKERLEMKGRNDGEMVSEKKEDGVNC